MKQLNNEALAQRLSLALVGSRGEALGGLKRAKPLIALLLH
jgi:hypothetical protein